METLNNEFSKNQLQLYFNQIKGEVVEINIGEAYSNVTLNVGHQNSRQVNIVAKNLVFEKIMENIKIGDKVIAKYYLTSNKKNERYYTTATLLECFKEPTNAY
jgi:molybdopterin-binding protein